MKKTTKNNLGIIAKRASKIYDNMKSEYKAGFIKAHGDSKKIKAAAAEYRKKYGSTPTKRWKKAVKMAQNYSSVKEISLFR